MCHHQQHDHQLEKTSEVELPFLDAHGLEILHRRELELKLTVFQSEIRSFLDSIRRTKTTCRTHLPLVEHSVETNQARQLEETGNFEDTEDRHA